MAENFTPGRADETEISLSQAILAPLDALFKAQVHAARSFINFLFQIGYPHIPINPETNSADINLITDPAERAKAEQPFSLKFAYSANEKDYTIQIPALAMVPLNSMAIDSGEFRFGLKVTSITNFEQMQDTRSAKDSGGEKRPWYLISNPVSLQGQI